MFPFLIGKLQTAEALRFMAEYIRFPFLIGKLQTTRRQGNVSGAFRRFPFLIGKLQTCHACGEKGQHMKFPFLIGKLQTLDAVACFAHAREVSIPHR